MKFSQKERSTSERRPVPPKKFINPKKGLTGERDRSRMYPLDVSDFSPKSTLISGFQLIFVFCILQIGADQNIGINQWQSTQQLF